jgi:hypothetical protein
MIVLWIFLLLWMFLDFGFLQMFLDFLDFTTIFGFFGFCNCFWIFWIFDQGLYKIYTNPIHHDNRMMPLTWRFRQDDLVDEPSSAKM